MPFPFESLDVYKRALSFVEKTEEICAPLKGKLSFSLLDQMTRAALSIPLNIAEGNGRWHKREKIQFLRIARGSVFEIVPVIEVLRRKHAVSDKTFAQCYEDLQVMAKMLTALIKSVETLNRPVSGAAI